MALLFSTQRYQYLKKELLAYGTLSSGEIELKYFPDGERYMRLLSEVEGQHIAVLGGTISEVDTLELYDLAYAAVQYGAASLTVIIPYFGYSTMERAVQYGEVVTAKNRATLLSSIPRTAQGNNLILMDLHTEGLPFYFGNDWRTVHLYCKSLITEAAFEMAGTNFVLGSTDAGRAKWVESLANDMGVNAAFLLKRRTSGSETEVMAVSADVVGQHVVIYDDMIRTGGSLVGAAEAYSKAGAARISVITTHGLFSGNGLEKLKNCKFIERVVSSNTHPNALQFTDYPFLMVKSVAPILNQWFEKNQAK